LIDRREPNQNVGSNLATVQFIEHFVPPSFDRILQSASVSASRAEAAKKDSVDLG
jgi:hypothetical protein